MKSLTIDSPLDNRNKEKKEKVNPPIEKEIKVKKLIKEFGEVITLNDKIINRIDFLDKTYINRIYNNTDDIVDEELLEMKASIKEIGLINIVYLLKKDKTAEEKDLVLISGLRRSIALLKLIEDGEKINFPERVVIFEKDVPIETLEHVSIDENLQRKNLTLLEQSYKFNKEAKTKDKSIDQILEDNNISKKHFYRIKKAMDYPVELKEILDEVGITKAEIINNIIKIKKKKTKIDDVIHLLKDLSKEELKDYLRNFKKKNKPKKEKISYKSIKNKITIELNISESEEFLSIYKEFEKEIKKL